MSVVCREAAMCGLIVVGRILVSPLLGDNQIVYVAVWVLGEQQKTQHSIFISNPHFSLFNIILLCILVRTCSVFFHNVKYRLRDIFTHVVNVGFNYLYNATYNYTFRHSYIIRSVIVGLGEVGSVEVRSQGPVR